MRARAQKTKSKFVHSMVPSGFVEFFQRSRFWLVIFSALILASSACESQRSDSCSVAIEFRELVSQIDTQNAFGLLDEEFWRVLKSEVDNLTDSTDGELREKLVETQSHLEKLIGRLEDVDYNVLAAITDPETADIFADTTAALVQIAANEIDSVIRASC